MTESLGQLWINLGVKSTVKSDLSGVTSQISAVNTVSSGASSGLGKLKTAAVAVTAAVGTAGLVAGTKKAVGMFQDFEKSVSNAASVTGKTGEAFEQAKKNISAVAQELGQATAFSSSQAADAMYNLASAGYDVSTMSANDLTPMLNLAAATQYDLAETTSTTASTLSQFGLGFESAGRVADVFTSVIGKSQANMEMLSYSMKYVGTIANTAGMGIEETSAALGTLYNAGLDGSSAGTGLRGVLASLIKPSENAGSALQAMGLEMEDINPVTHGFSNVMKTLADHGLDAEKAFWLFGREAAPAALAMASNSDGLKQLTTELQNAGGTAQTVADEQLDTLAGSLDGLSGSIENMMINIGQALAPTIRQIADALVPMVPAVQDFVIGIVNTFVTFVSQLGGSVSSIKAIGGTIYDVFSSVFQAVAGTGSSVASSAADVINGIMQQIAGVITGAAPLIQSILVNVVTFIKSIITGLGPTWENLKGIAQNVGNIFKTLFTNISSAASPGIANTISGVINTITLALSMFSDVVAWAVSAVVPKVKGLFSGVIDAINTYLPDLSTINEKLGVVFEQLPFVIESVVEKLTPIWNTLKIKFNELKPIFNDVARELITLYQSLKQKFGEFTKWMGDEIKKLDPVWTQLKTSFNTVKQVFIQFVKDYTPTWDEIKLKWGELKVIFNNAITALQPVWNILKGALDAGINIFNEFVTNLGPTWDNLKVAWGALIDIFDQLKTAIGDNLKSVIESVAPQFKGFLDSLSGTEIGNASGWGKTLAGVLEYLTGKIKDFLVYIKEHPEIIKFAADIVTMGIMVA
ncbi:MAG: phage tail tape measure protein, partial [Bacilli bacterium]